MKINITTRATSPGTQIFDILYAYRQSLNNQQGLASKYSSDWLITIGEVDTTADLNILFDHMPDTSTDLDSYDLVFLCNNGEPLRVATPCIAELVKLDKVYLVANSYLDQSHPLFNKVIWFTHNFNTCKDYWTRYFYPQRFENLQRSKHARLGNIIAINGLNRANRHHFFKMLKEQCPELPMICNIGETVTKLLDSQWESVEDQQFRDSVNNHYVNKIPSARQVSDNYYSNIITVGINNKFGDIPPGYFIMPAYFEYACVVFPETTWQNNDLAITEKALKCFYARSLPFPIGGARTNQLYNELEFFTAWNLLPEELKQFDNVLDHNQRYHLAAQAVDWLYKNPQVFQSDLAKTMVEHNRNNFIDGKYDLIVAQSLEKIILSYQT